MKYFWLLILLFSVAVSYSIQETYPTGGGSGGLSAVSVTSGELSGDGSSASPLKLVQTSATMQGNAFNGASQLIQADGSGLVADGDLSSNITKKGNTFNGNSQLVANDSSGEIVDDEVKIKGTNGATLTLDGSAGNPIQVLFKRGGSAIFALEPPDPTNDVTVSSAVRMRGNTTPSADVWYWHRDGTERNDIGGRFIVNDFVALSSVTSGNHINAGGEYQIDTLLAFSSVPVHHACGANMSAALAAGTTFSAFTPTSAIYLRRCNSNIVVASAVGTMLDSVQCGIAASSMTATTAIGAAAGTYATGTSTGIAVSAGTKVSIWLQGDTTTKPLLNACVEYVMQ